MNPSTVRQYSAQLHLPNHLNIELMGDDFGTLKESAQRLLNGGARFEPLNPTPGAPALIYHPTYDGGKTPLGWVNAIDVPEHMSTKAIELAKTESRKLQAA